MFKWVRDFLGSVFQKKTSSRDLGAIISGFPSSGLPYPAAWTDWRTEQVKHFKYWSYIAIDCIASKIGEQLPNVSYVTPAKGHDHYDNTYPGPASTARRQLRSRTKALTPLQAHEHLEPAPHDHPLVQLLRDPNDPDTSYDLIYETELYLELTGNAFWWTPLNKQTGLPEAIWVLPSHWMWPVFGKAGQQAKGTRSGKLIDAWELRPVEGNYIRRRLPAEEIIHFKRKSPVSKLDGHSPMSAIAQWADSQEALNLAKWNTYKQGPFPTMTIQFDANMFDPTKEQLDRIEQKFFTRYGGEGKAGKPLILPPGVKATPLSLKPNEMLFGENEDTIRDNILAAFRISPAVIGIAKATTYGALRAAQAGFYNSCINPRCTFLGQVLTEKLAMFYDPTLRVWWDDFTPDDPAQLESEIRTDFQCGAITVNEIRVLRGREPYPEAWANKPMLPLNMTTPGASGQPGKDPISGPLGGDNSQVPPQSGDQPNYPDPPEK